MPVSYKIDKLNRLVHTTALGTLTLQELMDHHDSLRQDPDFSPGLREIRDMTGAYVALSDTERQELAVYSAFGASSRRAFVTDNDEVRHRLVTFQELKSEEDLIRVFSTVREAYEWLTVFDDRAFKTLFDASPDAIVLANSEGVILLVNQQVLGLFGYAQDDLIGHPVERLIPDRYDNHKQLRSRFIADPYPLAMEKRSNLSATARDGKEIPVEISLTSITLQGEQFFVATIRDVTQKRQSQLALENQQQVISNLLDVLPVSVIVYEKDGTSSFANARAKRIVGISADQFGDQKFYRAGSDLPYPREEMPRIQALAGKTSHIDDLEIELKNGSRMPIEVWSAPLVTNDAGEIIQSVSVASDITERRQAELALQESESKYRNLVDASQALISRTDVNGLFTYLNPAWTSTLGYDLEEMLGHHFTEFKNPAEVERSLEAYKGILARGSLTNYEARYLSKSGQELTLNFSVKPIYNGSGKIVEVQATAQNITEKKRIEAELNLSEERYRELIERSTDIIWRTTPEGSPSFFSPSLKTLLGFEPEEMLGLPAKQFREIMFSKESISYLEAMNERRRHGEFGRRENAHELVCNHKNGHQVEVEVRASSVLNNDGELVAIQGIIRDISDIKKAKEERDKLEVQLRQSQKMEALGTLAGGIAHDFNNILTPILGNAELLMESPGQERDGQSLQSIYDNALRARDLVAQVLLFSRPNQSTKKVTNLCPLIPELVSFVRSTLPSSITVSEAVSVKSAAVLSDASQIHQALVNLLVNAGHAITGAGQISISLDVVNLKEFPCVIGKLLSGKHVRIAVTDNGIGMDEQTRAHIFEPFYTTKGVGEGTGLGLSTVFGIVQDHGGGLSVSSEPGKGSTFEIFLPLAEAPVEKSSVTTTKAQYRGSEHILFVDDEDSITTLGKRSLERLGYQVTVASNGQAALAIFSEHPEHFDMLVTDQTMPKLTGDLLTHEVLKIKPGIPIMLCSGHNTEVTPENSKSFGVRRFMYKPYGPKELGQAVREVLDEAVEEVS